MIQIAEQLYLSYSIKSNGQYYLDFPHSTPPLPATLSSPSVPLSLTHAAAAAVNPSPRNVAVVDLSLPRNYSVNIDYILVHII
jgi:hypothetical protein